MRLILATAVAALPVLVAAVPHPVTPKIGTSIPITKRGSFVNDDNSVNIDALKSQVTAVRANVLRGFANYEKNTGSPHPAEVKGARKRATGAEALTADSNKLWYGSISVGTPPVTFTVDFDTGSSDLFLPGPDCTSNCQGHTIYDPSASLTSSDLGETFSHQYRDGSTVSGELYSDTVSIAGLNATDQTLGVASNYSSGLDISQFPPDGLMGMAFREISEYNASSVFETLVSQGQTDQAVFSFKLAASGSELYLGGADSSMYTGDFTYVKLPVAMVGYWQVKMDAVIGHGAHILTNVQTIIDTGSSLIIGIPSDVATLSEVLGGTNASSTAGPGYYTFPCNSFPSISFVFGGTTFDLSDDSLNLGPVSAGSSDCLSGIVGQDTASSFWIIGDVFLTNVYTTFDVGNMRVGFAQLA